MKNSKLMIIAFLSIFFIIGIIYFSDVLSLFAISGLIAFLLSPIANTITKHFKIKHGFSIVIVFAIVIGFLSIIITYFIPIVLEQIKAFLSNLPFFVDKMETFYNNIIKSFDNIPPNIVNSARNFIGNIDTYILNIALKLGGGVLSISAKILDLVVIVILTIYFMLDSKKILEKIASLFPKPQKIIDIGIKSYNVTWTYLKTQLIISFSMAICFFLILKILGVHYALLLSIAAFILDFIPYFGSILAGVISALVSLLTGGFAQALIVTILVLIIQQVQGNIIIPKVQGNVVGLHPIVVMFAILACNKLWGPMGMFLAIPIFAMLKIILFEIYEYIKS